MRQCLLIIAGLAIVTVGSAAQPSSDASRADKSALERAMRPIVLSVPGMDRVTIRPNLEYTSTRDPLVRMDVYVPADLGVEERRPVVLLVHGGVPASLPVKDMGAFRSWGRLIASQRMIAVTFTHRLRWPLRQVEEAANDVRAALDFIRKNAATFNVDPERICIAAFSAGGPLTTVALQDERRYVRCQLAMYPLVDATGSDVVDARRFALSTYVDQPSFVPLFVARAGRDAIPTLNERLDRFIAAALAANASITLMNHSTGMHGFDVENDDARSREIIRAALEFMKTHLEAHDEGRR